MLPKFRPAAIGVAAAARPSLRPVKPGPPPPPPRPPRRASGFGRRDGFPSESPPPITTPRIETSGDADTPTVDGPGDRGVAQIIDAARARADHSFEVETQARPLDEELLATRQAYALERAQQHAHQVAPYENVNPPVAGDLSVPYDALPSLEVRGSYESRLEPPDDEEEALTRHGGASRDRIEARDAFGRAAEVRPREGSGARERPRPGEPRAPYTAPAPPYEESGAPSRGGADDLRGGAGWEAYPDASAALAQHAAPAEPSFPPPRDEVQRAFPVGVQPLRAPPSQPPPAASHAHGYGEPSVPRPPLLPHEATAALHGAAPTPRLGPVPPPSAHGQYPPGQASYSHASYAPAPMPVPAALLTVPEGAARSQLPVPPRQPVGPLVQEGSKLGRLPWFVAGVTFGIAFMFLATGVVQRSATPEPAPSAAQAPTATAPALTPPAAVLPAASSLSPVTPAALPAVPPAAPGNVYVAPVAAPTVYAPAPPPTGFAAGAYAPPGGYPGAEPIPQRAPAPPSTGAPYVAPAPQPRPAPARPQPRRASAPPSAAAAQAQPGPVPAPAPAPAPANDLKDLMNQALSP